MFQNDKILILGLARSGYEAAKVLVKRGNEVVLNDSKEEEKLDSEQIAELRSLGVKLVFGSHPDDLLDESFKYLIKNPGVPIEHKYVLKAKSLGIEVINEVEMAYRLLPKDINLIAITGTNGKTTTTTITYEILKKAYGDKVHLAGNIGFPLSSILEDLKEGDILVMEISAQQGENLVTFRPNIGVVTNFFPAHLEFFHDFDYYKSVKSKMFYNQLEDDTAIINLENEDVLQSLKGIKSNVKYFSSKNEINGIYLKNNYIYYYGEAVIDINTIKIKGIHNVENCMCSIGVCKELGVSNDIICSVMSSFNGVSHRLEYVDTVNGVDYYNDTEATNIKCTQIALSSFDKPIIIFLGGLERGQDFNLLTPYMNNVKAIIAMGSCRQRVEDFAKSINKEVFVYEHLNEGFDKAVELAEPGDIVLLSPASASWDQYKECEVRGDLFKERVHKIKESNE